MTVAEIGHLDDDASFSREGLPDGWTSAQLKNGLIIDVQPGFACGQNNRAGDGIAHLRPMNVNADGQIDLSIVKYVPETRANRDERLLRQSDVLFNNTNSPELVGKTSYYNLPEPRAFSNHMTRLRCDQRILAPLFCAIALHQKWREGYFRAVCSHHVSQSSVSRNILLETPILLPPLGEQKRIVAKVEQLLARVNAARKRLAKVPEILKRFRQAVLAAACSGRLTADWLEKQTNVRPVKEVLGRIQRSRLEQATTPAQKKKLEDIYSYQEREDSKPLPETWGYIALDKLCESFQYGTSKKSQPSGEIPVLRMGNIQNGEIDWSDLVYTSDSTEIQKYELDTGDVLFNRTNSPELVGKTAIYRGKQPAIFAGYLIRINNLEELESEYLSYCLNSIYARDFCLKTKTDGVSQSNINAQKLGKFEVPFCSKEEQHEIVHRVEALFKVADIIENRVAVATAHAEKLTQAILAKAFRGELVPTEAELARREGRPYEPASALLAKIEAQRKAVKPQRKRGNEEDHGNAGVNNEFCITTP